MQFFYVHERNRRLRSECSAKWNRKKLMEKYRFGGSILRGASCFLIFPRTLEWPFMRIISGRAYTRKRGRSIYRSFVRSSDDGFSLSRPHSMFHYVPHTTPIYGSVLFFVESNRRENKMNEKAATYVVFLVASSSSVAPMRGLSNWKILGTGLGDRTRQCSPSLLSTRFGSEKETERRKKGTGEIEIIMNEASSRTNPESGNF